MATGQAAKVKQLALALQKKAEELEAAETASKSTDPLLSDVLDLTDDLRLEASGPFKYLFDLAGSYVQIAACATISEFNLAKHVPDEGSISYEELSKQSGCSLDHLTRLLRMAILMRLFVESTPGQISHTPLTKMWKDNEVLAAMMGHFTRDMFPAAAFVPEALRKFGDGQEPNQTGVALANGSKGTLWDILSADPPRITRFNTAMKITTSPETSFSRKKLFDWSNVNLFVDIGGGEGHIAIDIAKDYPKFSAVVLDLKDAVAAGQSKVPADVAGRISFQVHDFLNDNPPKDADVYFLSHILHDWPDKYVVKILQAIVPSMKPGSKILIAESIMPEPGTASVTEEKFMRFKDLQMMFALNAKERTVEQFKALFAETDSRLQFKNDHRDPKVPQAGSIIEVEFTG